MKKRSLIVTLSLITIVAVALAWNYGRSDQTIPGWNHLRLGLETNSFGTLSSVENGCAVFIKNAPERKDTQRVYVQRLSDGQTTTIDPISQVSEADEVNLYDVSVGKSGIVALSVKAILNTVPTATTAGLLLVYNWGGNLLAAQRLGRNERDDYIVKLNVDDENTIWAVTHGHRDDEPTTAPFLCKYTDLGAKVNVVYTRESLPEVRPLRPYVRGVGIVSFGTTKESVYCWIPAIQELVIMAKDGSRMRRVPLAVPRPEGATPQSLPVTRRLCFTDQGTAVAEVSYMVPCDDQSARSYKPYLGLFAFDVQREAWRELRYELPPVQLVGVDGKQIVLASKWISPTVQDSSYQLFKRSLDTNGVEPQGPTKPDQKVIR